MRRREWEGLREDIVEEAEEYETPEDRKKSDVVKDKLKSLRKSKGFMRWLKKTFGSYEPEVVRLAQGDDYWKAANSYSAHGAKDEALYNYGKAFNEYSKIIGSTNSRVYEKKVEKRIYHILRNVKDIDIKEAKKMLETYATAIENSQKQEKS